MTEKISQRWLKVCFFILVGLVLAGLFSGIIFSPASVTQPMIGLEPVIAGLEKPLYVTHAGDGSGRLFIIEQQRGRIRVLQPGATDSTIFLDIGHRLPRNPGREQGVLGLAFHPQFKDNRRFFVNYTQFGDGASVIAEHRASASEPNVAPISETVLLTIVQPLADHNVGQLQFGPDGYLYIGSGDGGCCGDRFEYGQNLRTLLGKLLRIDVDAEPPFIPPTNPFVGREGLDEIWAYGLRNPWRFSFDRGTGDLYIGDVGQARWEEIDLQPAGSPGGKNYGWDTMEGPDCFEPPANCDRTGLTLPIYQYAHRRGGRCREQNEPQGAVIGGYVYRGRQIPELVGTYLFGDFCFGTIWGLKQTSPGVWERTELLQTDLLISSFGEDEDGEIYVVDLRGAVYRIRVV